MNKSIGKNVSSSAVGSAMQMANMNQATQRRNELFGNKYNMEQQMRNQNIERADQARFANIDTMNQYAGQKAQRDFGIIQDYSKNIANLSG
jgi:hypothetical protein